MTIRCLLALLALALALTPPIVAAQEEDIKISHVNVLLPWRQDSTDEDVEMTAPQILVRAKPGCFVWESSNPSVAVVEPQYRNSTEEMHGCSSRAIVRAAWQQQKRAKAIVKAKKKDLITGNLGYDLRCEVWVAPIESIVILTTVRKLSLGTTEKIEVQAFDSSNNVFSSLAGLRFDWTAPNRDILRILPLTQTKVAGTQAQVDMERRGMLTDSVQIEGVKTGRGRVTVRLNEMGYEGIGMAAVNINVSRPLELEPKNARYVSPCSELQMELYTYDKKKYIQIHMPTPQYKWEETSHQKIMAVDTNTGLIVGKQEGNCDVIARDQEILENHDMHNLDVSIPGSMQFVIVPASFELSPTTTEQQNHAGIHVTDKRVWYLVKGRHYAVRVVLRDLDHRTMYITKNVQFDIKYGQVSSVSSASAKESVASDSMDDEQEEEAPGQIKTNANLPPSNYAEGDRVKKRDEWKVQRRWVTATKVGKTMVHGVLQPIASSITGQTWRPTTTRPGDNGKPETINLALIHTSSEIIVSDPVRISRPTETPIILPPMEQNYQVKAVGGTGRYLWSSDESELASIGPTGAITANEQEGTTTVHVSDEMNRLNDADINVEIATVAGIIFMPGPVEAEVDISRGPRGSQDATADHDLYVHVGAVDNQRRSFHACTILAKDITTDIDENNKIFQLIDTYVGPSPHDVASIVGPEHEELYSRSCVTLRLRPLQPGQYTLKVSYGLHGRHGSAEVELYAFPPLRWIIPGRSSVNEQHTAVVSLYSTATVQLVGGPQPRGHSLGQNSVDHISVENEDSVDWYETDIGVNQTRDAFTHLHGSDGVPHGRIYSFHCTDLGEQTITFAVANDRRALSSDHMLDVEPVTRTVYLRFVCADPAHTQIIMHPLATIDGTPTSLGPEEPTYFARTLAPVSIYLRVLDEQKRPFLNFSTIDTTWFTDKNSQSNLELLYRRCAQNDTLLNNVDEYGNVDVSIKKACAEHGPTGEDGRYPGTYRDLIVVGGGGEEDEYSQHAMLQRKYLFGLREGLAKVTVETQVCPSTHGHGAMQEHANKHSKGHSKGQQEKRGVYCKESALVSPANLKLRKNVQLKARRAVLFRQPENTLMVHAVGGTRQFSFTFNNPEGDIAEMHQNSSVSVELDPQHHNGQVSIEVNDIGLTETNVARSDITVSDVNQLRIRVEGDKIARGAQKQLRLSASTYDGAWFPWFPSDQLALMDVGFEDASATHVSISMQPCEEPEAATQDTDAPLLLGDGEENNQRNFCITGLKVGNTEIIAFVKHADGRIVTSQALSITVFEPLQLQPRRLVLLPGTVFDVDHRGGPKTELIYHSTNESVAVVDNKGIVKALQLGEAIVYVEAQGLYALTGEKVVHARDAIPVRVALLDNVEIVWESRKVLVGRDLKLRVRGRNDESPFTFGTYYGSSTSGAAAAGGRTPPHTQIQFVWSTDKATVLALDHRGRYDDNDEDSAHLRNYAVWASAKSPGKNQVSVQVKSKPIGSNANGPIYYPEQVFLAKMVVSVVMPLELKSPSVLLLWPGATSRVRTNADRSEPLVYKQSVVDTGFPEIVEFVGGDKCTGKIKAKTVPGKSTVYVFNEAQDQSVSVNVEVKEIAQLRIVGTTNMYVGDQTELDVVVVDDMGRPFNMDTTLNVKYISNLNDFEIKPGPTKNNSFLVKATNEGEMIAKVYLSTTSPPEITVSIDTYDQLVDLKTAIPPKKTGVREADVLEAHTYLSDYVTLRSVHPILPPHPVHLHVGGHVHFSSNSISQQWSSSSTASSTPVLTVDPTTGSTIAKTSGTAYVKHTGAHRLINRAQVIVHTVQKITMNTSSTQFIVPGETYVFPVTMYGADGAELVDVDPSIQQRIQLKCRYNLNTKTSNSFLDENSVDVTSKYDATSGKHACVVKVFDTSTKFAKDHEFPLAKYISLVATASDGFENSRSTYTYRETLPNRIPFIPNMRVRVRYPHDLPSDRGSGTNANPSTMRGKLLLGCVELQPRTPFAFLEVFVRSDVAETPLEYSGPPEVTIERTEHSISDPAGWTKFTYKIAVRNREVGFKETDIQFVHAQSGQSQERCVSYGQKHEHQWYCAVQDSSKSGSSPEVTRYKRNYCQQCPSTMSKRSDGAADTRVRLLRCCVPNSGDVCEVEEVTKSYFCKGSPKPPTDCGDFNLGATGTRSPGGDAGSEQWDDVDDSQLSTYMLAVVCIVATVVWKSGALWRCITDTLREWCCKTQPRDPRGVYHVQQFGGLNPVVPGGSRERMIHQRNARGINAHNRVPTPRVQSAHVQSASGDSDVLLTW